MNKLEYGISEFILGIMVIRTVLFILTHPFVR